MQNIETCIESKIGCKLVTKKETELVGKSSYREKPPPEISTNFHEIQRNFHDCSK